MADLKWRRSEMTAALWILIGLVCFATLLAAQMRFFISVALRRALAAKFSGDFRDGVFHTAVQAAGRRAPETEAERHLAATYPSQIAQLKLARRVSLIGPGLILVLALLLRLRII
jgi:nucleoside-diphosphate-sugar epimerase